MKKYISLFLILLTVTCAVAQQTTNAVNNVPLNLTLEECIEYALQNNYDRKSLDLDLKIKEVSYQQSKQERLPDLSASAKQSVINTPNANLDKPTTLSGNYGINSNFTLFNGGIINNTITKNKYTAEQAEHQNKQYDNTLMINIIKSFLSILSNDELLKYQQYLVKTSEEQAIQGKEQLQAGTILESDYLLLEAQYATDKYNVENTQITRNNNMLALKNLLSLQPEQELTIISPDTTISQSLALLPALNDVMQTSLQMLPDLEIAKYDILIAETGIKLAQGGFYPTVTLGAGIASGHNSNASNGWGSQVSKNINEQASLSINIPIFSNNRNRANVKQSQMRLKQAELNENQTILNIMQQVEQDYKIMTLAYSKYTASEVNHNATKASFDAYSEKFKAGAITTVDLLIQQNNYINALNNYVQSKYTFILDRKILDVYMGIPVKL